MLDIVVDDAIIWTSTRHQNIYRGLSTGDFREALPVLLGKDAPGLSPTNIARLTAAWDEEYQAFRRRDLSACDYVYVWVDGIHFNIRLEEDRLCTLVMIGVTADGTKELVALEDGYRESTESWASVLRDLRGRGLRAPAVAVGDGALGFWSAMRDVWPETTPQRAGHRESTESWASVLRDLRGRGLRAPAVAVGDGALGFWSWSTTPSSSARTSTEGCRRATSARRFRCCSERTRRA